MQATIFNTIASRIKAKMPEIRQIEIYNDQYNNIEDEAYPVFPPAAFIEFEDIEWSNLGELVQQAIVTVNIHIVTEHIAPFKMNENSADVLAYAQSVTNLSGKLHQALHGFVPITPLSPAQPIGISMFKRISTSQVQAPPTLHVWKTRFAFEVVDASAQRQYTTDNVDELNFVVQKKTGV